MNTPYPITLRALFIAVALIVLILGAWEYTTRQMGFGAWVEDDKHLWAEQRAKVERATSDDVVLIGSSRVLFDIQLDMWEAETGRKPIMLALPGSNSVPVFKDIVERTEFAGTLVVGVTPGLYFSPPIEQIPPWSRPMARVNHYYKRTYAQRTGHWLSQPLQRTFAFLQNDDDTFYNDLDLRTLIARIPLKPRIDGEPPFPFFGYVDRDRNMQMIDRVTQDTTYAQMIQKVWAFFASHPRTPEEIAKGRDAEIGISRGLVEKFKARGGKIIFVRCPSSGRLIMGENKAFPRETFWDALITATGCPGYYFEDYPLLSKYTCPEWSHLSTPDAKNFTRDLVRQMKQDGNL